MSLLWLLIELLCLVADCGLLTAPEYGFVDHLKTVSVYGSVIFTATAEFSCQRGFALSGESELLCLETGLWSSPIPECRKWTADYFKLGRFTFMSFFTEPIATPAVPTTVEPSIPGRPTTAEPTTPGPTTPEATTEEPTSEGVLKIYV